MREPMLTSGDLNPKICFEISPQHEFTFYGGDGQVVGTMNFSCTPAFEGSLDESAHLFFNGVVNLWNNEISELRAKLQAAEAEVARLQDEVVRLTIALETIHDHEENLGAYSDAYFVALRALEVRK